MNYPRTSFVLNRLGITQTDARWLKPQYSRSGRYIHAGALWMAQGHELDEAWFTRTSGEGPNDTVVHEDCRPKLNGYAKFQRDHKPKFVDGECELVHPVYKYTCHPDQILVVDGGLALYELKSGLEMDWHELQLASYLIAAEHRYQQRVRPVALYLEPDDYRLVPLPDPWRAKQKWIALMAGWNVMVEHKSALTEDTNDDSLRCRG